MVFTESDAENDGLIKREVGREMAKVAKTQNPEVFGYFEEVCQEVGRSPADVLGEMCVLALNDEQYAQRVMSSELNMKKLRADDIRVEDVKYVKKLSEELGMNETEEKNDPIERLIESRIESVSESPMEKIQERRHQKSQGNGQMQQNVAMLGQKLDRLESKIDGESVPNETQTETVEQDQGQSVDDLFEDSDSEGEAEQSDEGGLWDDESEEGEVAGEVQEIEHEDLEAKPEPEPEEELDEGAIEEAMSGVVDDEGADTEEDGEDLAVNIDIPAEQEEEDDGFFTSEDGVEE